VTAGTDGRPLFAVLLMELKIAEQAEVEAKRAVFFFKAAVHNVINVVFLKDNRLAELVLALGRLIFAGLLVDRDLLIWNCLSTSLIGELAPKFVLAQDFLYQLMGLFWTQSHSAGASAASLENLVQASLAIVLIAGGAGLRVDENSLAGRAGYFFFYCFAVLENQSRFQSRPEHLRS